MVGPAQRRALVRWRVTEKKISQRRACRWVGLNRNAVVELAVVREKDKALQNQIEQVANRYKQWGVLKIYHKLRQRGERVNPERVRRLYEPSGLSLRRKSKKRLPEAIRQPLPNSTIRNGCWSLDFTADSLRSGQKFRTLNVIDDYSWEALGVEVDFSLPAQRVIRLLDRLVKWYGKPERLRSDNSPEFISQDLLDWCSNQQIELHQIAPGKQANSKCVY